MPPSLSRLIHVLVVEDEENDFLFVRLLLSRRTINRYELDWAPTYEAGIEALKKRRYDTALVDYRLGGETGLDWLRAVEAAGNPMPIILLTGADSLEIDQEAAASGAADFLCKVRLDTVRLERSIRYALRQAEIRAELQRTTALLRAMVQNLPVMVGRLDRDGRVMEVEGSGLESRGLSPAALIGRRLSEVNPASAEAISRALAGKPASETICGGEGDEDWAIEFFAFRDREPAGSVIFFGQDVTERRHLERRVLSISDEQQRRIGADLHDNLGQHLTGIACLAGALRDQLKRHQPERAEKAHQIAGLVNGAIELTRMLARGLCPVQVDQGGLHAALEDLAGCTQRVHGVSCWLENGGGPTTFDPVVSLQLYRIAQEAVTNAIRHGAADQIVLKLDFKSTPHRLVIEDNGQGFAVDGKRFRPGLGLHLMEQRADLIGGTFKVTPRSGGTRVECTFNHRPCISHET